METRSNLMILTSFLFWTSSCALEREIAAVTVLYRHGDRTPVRSYPTDPYKDASNWPVDFGQLTPKGKMRQYKLGQFFRKRYGSLLPEIYNETDIYVRSTDVDRTLMSALSNLAGLYPPVGDQVWNPALPWQPIPVHTVPDGDDDLIGKSDCPKFDELLADVKSSPEMAVINDRYRWVYDYISEKSESNISDVTEAGYFYDTLHIEQMNNMTLPNWTKKVFPEPLKQLESISFTVDTWTHPMKRLIAGTLIQDILDRAVNFSKDTDSSTTTKVGAKMTMYSTHDTTLARFLDALDMFDPPITPSYASAVLVELWRRTTGDDDGIDRSYEIRILYRNETNREPYLLKLFTCDEFCPLSEFAKLTKDLRLTQVERREECRNTSEIHHQDLVGRYVTVVSLSVCAVLLTLLILSVIVTILRRSRIVQEVQYLPVDQYDNS